MGSLISVEIQAIPRTMKANAAKLAIALKERDEGDGTWLFMTRPRHTATSR
jgi:hypothetical protein